MARDQRYEHWLTVNGISEDTSGRQSTCWRYLQKFDLSKVDIDKSLHNQARLDAAIDETLAERYATVLAGNMEDDPTGSYFPAIIVYPVGDRYVIIDGNHRCKVKTEAGINTSDAYVVKCQDPDILMRLTKTANTVEGKRNTLDHDLLQVKALVENEGYPISKAAKVFGLKQNTCEKFIRRERVTETLRAHGMRHITDAKMGLKAGHLEDLYFLEAVNPKVMVRAAETIRSAQMDVGLARNFLGELKNCKSDNERWAKVAEWDTKPEIKNLRAQTMDGKLQRVKVNQTLRLMAQLLGRLSGKQKLKSLGITGSSVPQFQERSKQLREALLELERSAK